jgi:hypothetical protein
VDPFYAEALIEREREFWDCVVRQVPPPDAPELKPAGKIIEVERLRRVQLEDEFRDSWKDLNWAGELIPLIRTFAETDGAAKKHAITRNEIKALVPDSIGQITRGLWRLSRAKNGAVTMAMKEEKDG